jgi:hypothetical protein
MSAVSGLKVISPPPKRPVEILDSTSEIGTVFENYMAHFAKMEMDSRYAALEAFFVKQKEEAKPTGSRGTTYSNIGKTPQAINAIRATNQRNSALLRLPAELLISIWRIAFGSTATAHVHGMVCREISENRILSLVHACPLLHYVLYPIFLNQDAFVVKVSSSHSAVAASELTQWLEQLPFASVLNGPIKIQILLEVQTGRLLEAEARKLAAEVQAACSLSTTFQPKVYVETEATTGWYLGPGVNVQVWPPTAVSHHTRMARLTELEDDVWKGWVVRKRTLASASLSPDT